MNHLYFALRLLKDLPAWLEYHAVQHTKEVHAAGAELAKGLWGEEIDLLKIILSFHDTGFLLQYNKNEPYGALFAKYYMNLENSKGASYTAKRQKIVEDAILFTDISQRREAPSYLAKIARDADLHYLGKAYDYFLERDMQLYKEIKNALEQKIITPLASCTRSENDWKRATLSFMAKHEWESEIALQLYQANKENNMKQLRASIR